MRIIGVLFGDQNWGNPTYLQMRAHYPGGGHISIGRVDMNYEKDGQPGFKTRTRKGWSSVGGGQNCKARDNYGKSICRYYDNERAINRAQSYVSKNFACDHWKAVFTFGIFNCAIQKRIFNAIQDKHRKDLIRLQAASRSIIKLNTNLNPTQMYWIGATRPVNKITLFPSYLGSGHEAIYLGFSDIIVYESLK